MALPLIASGHASAAQPAASVPSGTIPSALLPSTAAPGAVGASGTADAVAATAQNLAAKASNTTPDAYTVVSGDTLFRIATAEDIKGGWQGLYEENREVIGEDPDLILPGQELALDGEAATPAKRKSESGPKRKHRGPKAEEKPAEKPAEQPAEKPVEKPAEKPDAPAETPAEPPASGGFSAPVDASPSTAYGVAGSMWSSGYHTGVDFAAPSGAPVKAVSSGTVVSAGWGGSYGNEVVIQHDDGRYSQYAHLSSLGVSSGQSVTGGQQIGLVGSTGNSTGAHLHFEVRTGPGYGSDIDPLAYLRSNGVTV